MKALLTYLAVGGILFAVVSIGGNVASIQHCNERGGVPVRSSTGGVVCLAPSCALPPPPPAPLRSM